MFSDINAPSKISPLAIWCELHLQYTHYTVILLFWYSYFVRFQIATLILYTIKDMGPFCYQTLFNILSIYF